MHAPETPQLERSSTITSLAPQTAGVAPAADCRGAGRQCRGGQPVDDTRPAGGRGGPPRPSLAWGPTAADTRAARAPTHPPGTWSRSLGVPRTDLDSETGGRGDAPGVGRGVSPHACGSVTQSDTLAPAETDAPGSPARRSGHRPLARRHLARDQKGAEAQHQTILFLDESGFYPLPSVVRTYAPVGQTPILREWYTRDHLSAISAISPEGKLYFRSQDRAINSDDVVAFLEHLLREVPGRMIIIWDGAPIHRSHTIREFLTHGAAPRLHLERLPAYAPELNPGEGLWHQLKGLELCNVCCFNLPHLRHELRDAVKRVRRKPRLITSFFQGAQL
jgi:transposase